jgi:hypothetical protein
MSTTPTPIDALKSNAAQFTPDVQAGGLHWPAGSSLLLRYFYFWKFSLNCGNDRGVLRFPRTPRQGVSCVSGIRDRIFFGAFFNKVRFRKFFPRCRNQAETAIDLRGFPSHLAKYAKSRQLQTIIDLAVCKAAQSAHDP